MPAGRQILRRDRALIVGPPTWFPQYGRMLRPLLLDTDECRARCCDGCPLWFEARECANGPVGCVPEPPPPRTLYICQDVPCQNGEPLAIGVTIYVAGVCWTIHSATAVPPDGSNIYPGKTPVLCVANCGDLPCPQGELWYRAIFCGPNPPLQRLYVCGVTRCEIRGCWILDPSVGGIPFDQIPQPGSDLRTLDQMGPVQPTCCDCEPLCEHSDMLAFDPRDPIFEQCYQSVAEGVRCCCDRQEPALGRIRLTRWRTTQRRVDKPNGTRLDEFQMISETISPEGCPTYRIRWDRTENGSIPPGWPFEFDAAPPCIRCGGWPTAPTMWLALDRIVSHLGIGGCRDVEIPEIGRTTVTGFDVSYTCRRHSSSVRYMYESVGGDRFDTHFEVTAELTDLGRCGRECGGGLIQQGVPVGIGADGNGGAVDLPGGGFEEVPGFEDLMP